MKVTVCVPTYNQAEFLPQALDSIVNQKECEVHIIVANDASSDNTKHILDDYTTKYPGLFTIINQPYNKGLVLNTRDCILKADSDYIAILEGDDYWSDKYKLNKQLALFLTDDRISLVHSNWIDYYQKEDRMSPVDLKASFNLLPENEAGTRAVEVIMLEQYRPIRFSSCIFKHEILLRAINESVLKFDNKYSTLDIAFFYAAAFYGKLAYLDEHTTVYRILNDTVSRSEDYDKCTRYGLGCYEIYRYFIKRLSLDSQVANHVIRRIFMSLFPYTLKTSNADLATYLKSSSEELGYKLRIGQRICLWGAKNRVFRKLAILILKPR